MNTTTKLITIYDDQLAEEVYYKNIDDAVDAYNNKCIDLGDAKGVATYNLLLPNNKMFTKHYDASGFIGGK